MFVRFARIVARFALLALISMSFSRTRIPDLKWQISPCKLRAGEVGEGQLKLGLKVLAPISPACDLKNDI